MRAKFSSQQVSGDGPHAAVWRFCSVTRKPYSVPVLVHDYERWINDDLYAQDVFPQLSAEQREFLISDTTPAEFDEMFGEDQ